ncbi:Retrovirus-related Pol polyprotein from transposon TNT 1-94 [Bienertia sinuspersici]
MDHIDPNVPKPTDLDSATWTRLDALVKQWIYATISKDIGSTILIPGATALQLWTRLKDLFQDHKETRAIYLEEQLASTKFVNLAIASDYCKQLKTLADQLANMDHLVTDKQLVLRLIAGLTKGEYNGVALLLQHQKPFPTFDDARRAGNHSMNCLILLPFKLKTYTAVRTASAKNGRVLDYWSSPRGSIELKSFMCADFLSTSSK